MRPIVFTPIALAAAVGVGLAAEGRPAPREARSGLEPGFYAPSALVQTLGDRVAPEPHEFFFTRAMYTGTSRGYGRGYGGRGSWATDWPKADRQFLVVLRRLVNLDAYSEEHHIALDDPAVRQFPFLYALEVGHMRMTQAEIHGLRDYLAAGGFLMIDDFWGSREWANFEYEMSMLLPGRPIVEIPLDHEIFHVFYDIDEILQVPNVRNATSGWGTSEQDGYVPHLLGIFDDEGRLMVAINWNTDLGDAWEWAEDPYYPLMYSTFAYEMGVNQIIYGMTH